MDLDVGVLLLKVRGETVDDLRHRPAHRHRVVEREVDRPLARSVNGRRQAGEEREGGDEGDQSWHLAPPRRRENGRRQRPSGVTGTSSRRRPVEASNTCAASLAHARWMRVPTGSSTRRGALTASDWPPTVQLTIESAPRYSIPVTTASRPRLGASSMSSGRTPSSNPAPRPVNTGGPSVPATTPASPPSASVSTVIGGVPMKRAGKARAGGV